MAGSGRGSPYVGATPDISPVVMAFLRKSAFLAAHPEWSIDYDRETDAYVATERLQPNSTTIVVEKSMGALIDNLTARCQGAADMNQ